MSQLSGIFGSALIGTCEILEFESWTLDYGPDLHPTASRATGVGQGVVSGLTRGSGTLTGYIDPTNTSALIWNVLSLGNAVTLTLRLTSGKDLIGSAKFGQFSVGSSRSGEPVQFSVPFQIVGTWTLP